MAFACSPAGVAPSVARGCFYKFAEPVQLARLQALAQRPRTARGEHGAGVSEPGQFYTWEGELQPIADPDLRRRPPLRGAASAVGGTAAPPEGGALADAEVAAAAEALPDLEPPEGRAWFVASHGPLPLGSVVALSGESVHLDAGRATFREGDSWQIAEAVHGERADAHRAERPGELVRMLRRATTRVHRDEHGKRRKPWKDVARQVRRCAFNDMAARRFATSKVKK
ncbi:unnamed protein product [Prorocentrum cordatum]|uniref:Uncharacterized protein n=1 Tax=Prorocentrum cordatum TaxID=2364126 RepID=A0ABN9Y7P4_9DINO|nr:unnamed protein product [Polarella glacialis]